MLEVLLYDIGSKKKKEEVIEEKEIIEENPIIQEDPIQEDFVYEPTAIPELPWNPLDIEGTPINMAPIGEMDEIEDDWSRAKLRFDFPGKKHKPKKRKNKKDYYKQR